MCPLLDDVMILYYHNVGYFCDNMFDVMRLAVRLADLVLLPEGGDQSCALQV